MNKTHSQRTGKWQGLLLLALCIAMLPTFAQAAEVETPVQKDVTYPSEDGSPRGPTMILSGYLPQTAQQNWNKQIFGYDGSESVNFVTKGSTLTFTKNPDVITTGLSFFVYDSNGKPISGYMFSPPNSLYEDPSTFIRFGSDVKDFFHPINDESIESATVLGIDTTPLLDGKPITLTFDVMTDDFGQTFDFGNPNYLYEICVSWDGYLPNGEKESAIAHFNVAVINPKKETTYNKSTATPKGYLLGQNEGYLKLEISNQTSNYDKGDIIYLLCDKYKKSPADPLAEPYIDANKYFPTELISVNYFLNPGETTNIYVPILYALNATPMSPEAEINWIETTSVIDRKLILARPDTAEEFDQIVEAINSYDGLTESTRAGKLDANCTRIADDFYWFGQIVQAQKMLYEVFGTLLPA